MVRFYNSVDEKLKIKRKDIPNGLWFRQCERCLRTIDEVDWENIKYYSRYKMILCDKCVDIKDREKIKAEKDLAGNYFTQIQYDGNNIWKELQRESLEELSECIDELEKEMLNDEIDEEKIFEIIDELKSIQVYMDNGINEGYTEY